MKVNNSRWFDKGAVAWYVYHELVHEEGEDIGKIENNEIAVHIKWQMSPITLTSRQNVIWSTEDISKIRDDLSEVLK